MLSELHTATAIIHIITTGTVGNLSLQSIRIIVNGEPREIPPQESVASLLRFLDLPLERVAVELNKVIVRKRDWDSTSVVDGSQIEVVEFVGGG